MYVFNLCVWLSWRIHFSLSPWTKRVESECTIMPKGSSTSRGLNVSEKISTRRLSQKCGFPKMRVYLYIKFGGGTVFRTLWFCTIATKWLYQIISASNGCKSDVTLRLKSTIVIFEMISLPFFLTFLPCRFFTWFSNIVQIWKIMAVCYTFLLRKYFILKSSEWNVLP